MLQVWHEAGVLASSLHRIFIEFNFAWFALRAVPSVPWHRHEAVQRAGAPRRLCSEGLGPAAPD